MNEEDKIIDSLYDCIDFLNLILEQLDLNKNISYYHGPLKILKRELSRDLLYFKQLENADI